MSNKSSWKTTSVQDCGCLNQQRRAFSTEPVRPGERRVRVKPCPSHAPPPIHDPKADCSMDYQEFWGLF